MEVDSNLLWSAGLALIVLLGFLSFVFVCFLVFKATICFLVSAKNLEEPICFFPNEDSLFEYEENYSMEEHDSEPIEVSLQKNMPNSVREVLDEELNNLKHLEKTSPDYNMCKNYMDWVNSIPWGVVSDEKLDIAIISDILDKEHHGLEDVKARILEFIAVSQLRGSLQGNVLCFCGPPGVGKTSIAKSIALALNREFFRFSVGGLSDVAELKGHRRTYIGALPGKAIQALKKTETENPVILIDEIDKMGKGIDGDPSAALLEMLDPEQNNAFMDHYLDVPVDLSKVLFICTANVTDEIPEPLQDRMEIIHIAGYLEEEKLAIAQHYIVPQVSQMTCLSIDKGEISITKEALVTLIELYCRESGVRNLRKHIEKIFRKAAYIKVSENRDKCIDIDEFNLSDFVGKPVYNNDTMYTSTPPPGVAIGLAWTSDGGTLIYIETISETGGSAREEGGASEHGKIDYTGNLGDVMKESIEIAYSFAKNFLSTIDPESKFLMKNNIHLHVPHGATPKDGPSAGCTIVTAIISLAINQSVNLAMTGEISLTGKILPVGGIKEKIMAAKRAKVMTIILPEANRADFEELSSMVKKDATIIFAENYQDVFNYTFTSNGKNVPP